MAAATITLKEAIFRHWKQEPRHERDDKMARPLTKHDKAGKRYVRPPAIEAGIDAALGLDVPDLSARVAVSDRGSADYLSSECLVHLIREAIRRDEPAIYNALTPVLFTRCEAVLRAKLPVASFPNAAALRDEVLSGFGELLASEGTGEVNDELDYFECCFNAAFRTFRIDMLRTETRRRKRAVPLANESGEIDQDMLLRLSETVGAPDNPEHNIRMKELLSAIEKLPDEERQAVTLCCVLGYDEESKDPERITAASLCGVTGRTIRNRLRRAAALLQQFDEEEP